MTESKGMSTMAKVIYFAVGLIVLSNVLLGYSTVDPETEVILFEMGNFNFEVQPVLYKSATFVSSILDSGLLIVLVSLIRYQNSRQLKQTSSTDTKMNVLLTGMAEMLNAEKRRVEVDPYMEQNQRDATVAGINDKLKIILSESSKIANSDILSIPDQIAMKLQQKDTFESLLNEALQKKDKQLVSYLTPIVGALTTELEKLTTRINV